MVTQRNDGGPAYPIPGLQNDADFNGMSLRDYFAAKALAALLTEPPWIEGGEAAVSAFSKHLKCSGEERYARVAYILADAMLAARERK